MFINATTETPKTPHLLDRLTIVFTFKCGGYFV